MKNTHSVFEDWSMFPGGSREREIFPSLLFPWMPFSLCNFSLMKRVPKCILNVVSLFQPAAGLKR